MVIALLLYKAVFIANTSLTGSFWSLYGIIVTAFLVSRIPYAYLYEDNHDTVYEDAEYPTVSAIIACKNEEDGIFKTITTCIESNYPKAVEVIVVDDGSTDGTKSEIIRAKDKYGDQVKLISFPENQGKREAMAAGVNIAANEIIVFVDSDSYLEPHAVRHIAEHFMADPKIGAVSGNTKVENDTENVLTRLQAIQYAISFDIYKVGESVHRTVTCCPGCFSAYRKVAIQSRIESWRQQRFLGIKGTFGDDRSLTNFVLHDWDVIYCEKAKATTIVPTRLAVYWRQQLRWKKSWIREGVLAGLFIWRRHPLASLGFYIHFTFPFLGPILAGMVVWNAVTTGNLLMLALFASGFMLIGLVFGLFVHVYRNAKYWLYMPIFSLFFVAALIWQMPYALLTVRDTKWGTR